MSSKFETKEQISRFRLVSGEDQTSAVLGNPNNFWLWSMEDGFDLTHPPNPKSDPITPRAKLQCALTPIIIDPAKTALLVIDFQNFNVSKALGNDVQAYFDAEDALLKYAIPAARKAKIQIIWVTTGYSDKDLAEMDPGPVRTFSWHSVQESDEWRKLRPGGGYSSKGERRNQKGIGADLGQVTLEDGTTVEAGGVLLKGTWNSWMHGRLAESYSKGQSAARPDVHFYKNRSSAMCDKMTDCTDYIRKENIRTLLFTGLNTDQCVMGTLQEAYSKGFDAILLKDGCGTNSPEYAQLSAEYNCLRSWGFLSSCKDLAEAINKIDV